MTKSTGLAAVRERIRQSFLAIHNDQRDREQRQADQEMLAAIQSEATAGTTSEEETVEVAETPKLSVEERANVYVKAALRAPHIARNTVRRTNVHGAYVIEEPREDAATLIAHAMRSLK
jgi:hypothetical protein